MRSIRLISTIIGVSAILMAQPALTQGPLQLSLGRAVDIALQPEGSTRVALAEESIRLAEIRMAQAKSAFMPRIDGSFQGRNQTANLRTFGFEFPGSTLPGGFTFPSLVGPFSVLDLRASAQTPLLDFTIMRKYKASHTGIDAAKADREVTRDEVANRVARA